MLTSFKGRSRQFFIIIEYTYTSWSLITAHDLSLILPPTQLLTHLGKGHVAYQSICIVSLKTSTVLSSLYLVFIKVYCQKNCCWPFMILNDLDNMARGVTGHNILTQGVNSTCCHGRRHRGSQQGPDTPISLEWGSWPNFLQVLIITVKSSD